MLTRTYSRQLVRAISWTLCYATASEESNRARNPDCGLEVNVRNGNKTYGPRPVRRQGHMHGITTRNLIGYIHMFF